MAQDNWWANDPVANPAPRSQPSSPPRGTIYTPPPKAEKPDTTYRVLTPQEAQQRGLDPAQIWQISSKGEVVSKGPISAATGPKSATQIEIEAKKEAEAKRAATVNNLMKEVRGYYASDIQGQPATRLFGATEYIPWLPKNERFNAASNAILPMIRPLVAQTAKEGDSDKEMQVFMAYIPQAGDSDITIEQKLRGLDILVSGMTAGKPPSKIVQGMQDAPPAPIAGGVGDTTGMQRVATGDRRWVEDTETNQTLYNMFRQGRSFEEMQAYAGTRGYRLDPNPEAFAYARKNPGYNPFNSAGRYEELSTRQKLATTSLAGYAGGATNALTFGLNDELYGAANALVGEDYTQARDRFQGAKRAVADMNPVSDILGNITGGMLLPVGAAAVGSRAAPGLTNAALGALARNPVKSAGAYGAAYGAGDQNDNRLMGAAVGGVGGLGGGAAGKYLLGPLAAKIGGSSGGQAVANAFEPVAGRIRQAIGGGARVAPAQVSRAETALGGNMADIGQARARIADAAEQGLPYSLADADPRLRILAGSVSRRSPEAYAQAENLLEPRLLDQNDRAIRGVEDYLAPSVNMAERNQQLQRMANEQSGPLYERAFDNNQVSWSPRLQQFIDDPISQEGLAKGMQAQRLEALAEGRPFDPMKYSVTGFTDEVAPKLTKTPNLRTVDAIRRGYGEILDEVPKNAFGQPMYTSRTRAISMAKDALTKELDDLTARAGNPDYAAARQVYGDFMGMKGALNEGFEAAPRGTYARDIAPRIQKMNPEQLAEYRTGFATRLRDMAADASDSTNAYKSIFGGLERRAKIGQVFPEGAPKFARRYELESDMAKTAREVMGGSPTAFRQAMDDALTPQMATALEIAGQGGTGVPGAGAIFAKASQMFAKSKADRAAKKNAEQLAPILFDQNPAGLLTYFDDVAARLKANEAYKNKWKGRAGLFGGSLTAPLLLNTTSGY